jgi:hypothetical protein
MSSPSLKTALILSNYHDQKVFVDLFFLEFYIIDQRWKQLLFAYRLLPQGSDKMVEI